jgi:hypothetical protein
MDIDDNYDGTRFLDCFGTNDVIAFREMLLYLDKGLCSIYFYLLRKWIED